jgi:membrane-bound serine protease (ClpP class)
MDIVKATRVIGRMLTLAGVVGGLCGGAAWADTLVKTDGTEMVGRVVGEDAQTLTFEQNMEGLVVRTRVAKAQVKTVEKEVVKGPGYCVLPLVGEVGTAITAETFHAAVEMARSEGAQYIVLDVESPGGSIPEMTKILAVIQAEKEITFIAHVAREAMSAAAILSMRCSKIYMSQGAAIGASVPFRIGPTGTPENIEAKFFSAVQSEMRGAAELGGHSPLFVRGMSEMDVELVLRHDGSTPVIAVAQPGAEKPGERIIKQRGKILTMTASEAEETGLSAGTLADVSEIYRGLGLSDWHRVGQGATDYLRKHSLDAGQKHAELTAENVANTLEEVEAKREAAQKKMAALQKEKDDAVNAVKAEYAKALDEQHAPQDLDKFTQQAKDHATAKLTEIDAQYDPQIVSAAGAVQLISQEEVLLKQMQERAEGR